MSDLALFVWTLGGVSLAAAVPLAVYAVLPQEKLNQLSQHGRFGGLTAREQAGRPSGNSPVPGIGSLQGQTA